MDGRKTGSSQGCTAPLGSVYIYVGMAEEPATTVVVVLASCMHGRFFAESAARGLVR